ncbi:MAG: hypothetical protein D4R45_07730 [Planctomycetaceae bacterium]|nr:MAG: hypothetical protein D4R45_07730 [Planctomycetaceae bacterium]
MTIHPLILSFFLLLEAVFEGLSLSHHLIASEIVEVVWLAGVTIGLFCWINWHQVNSFYDRKKLIRLLIGYVLLRFALFDLIFNVSAGLDINYIGDTKLFDKGLAVIRDMWGMSPIWFSRAIAGFWGTLWLLGK